MRSEPLTFRCKPRLKYFNSLNNTPFNRLQPFTWLPIILSDRVNRETHQKIAEKLDIDIKKIMLHDKAFKKRM